MIMHTLKGKTSVSAEVPPTLINELADHFTAGHPVCLGVDGVWVFPDSLFTTAGWIEWNNPRVTIRTGVDKRDPRTPGSCDARWFEVRVKTPWWNPMRGEIIKRAVNILANGITLNAAAMAGNVG